ANDPLLHDPGLALPTYRVPRADGLVRPVAFDATRGDQAPASTRAVPCRDPAATRRPTRGRTARHRPAAGRPGGGTFVRFRRGGRNRRTPRSLRLLDCATGAGCSFRRASRRRDAAANDRRPARGRRDVTRRGVPAARRPGPGSRPNIRTTVTRPPSGASPARNESRTNFHPRGSIMTNPTPMTEEEIAYWQRSIRGTPDREEGFGALRTPRGCLPLEALDVRAHVNGLLARTEVRQ